MLNESDIKLAVIDRLFALGQLRDAVLINEMVVANWSRRADLVVANGKLTAFEIKSDIDTLDRLQGQVHTYSERFDKVVIVTTDRFRERALNETNPSIGVWVARGQPGNVQFTTARAGKANLIKSKEMLCSFLSQSELRALLRGKGIRVGVDANRAHLVHAVESLPVSAIRGFVLETLKGRYRDTFDAFCDVRQERTEIENLAELSKAKRLLRGLQSAEGVQYFSKRDAFANAVPVNFGLLEAAFGAKIEGLPAQVIPRRKPSPS